MTDASTVLELATMQFTSSHRRYPDNGGSVNIFETCTPVSYTHLDVYKRQLAMSTPVTAEVSFQDPETEPEKIVFDDDDMEVGKEGKQSEN